MSFCSVFCILSYFFIFYLGLLQVLTSCFISHLCLWMWDLFTAVLLSFSWLWVSGRRYLGMRYPHLWAARDRLWGFCLFTSPRSQTPLVLLPGHEWGLRVMERQVQFWGGTWLVLQPPTRSSWVTSTPLFGSEPSTPSKLFLSYFILKKKTIWILSFKYLLFIQVTPCFPPGLRMRIFCFSNMFLSFVRIWSEMGDFNEVFCYLDPSPSSTH